MLAVAIIGQAQQDPSVYITPKGKAFHFNTQCMSLSRSTEVYKVSRKMAESHGLKPCKICSPRPAKPKPGQTTPPWYQQKGALAWQ
jgi:hypothetical protein